MKKTIVLFTALVLSALNINAQSDEMKIKKLDSILTAFTNKHMFNGSVLVGKKGKVLLGKGYGNANFSYNIPNTGETKFKLASVSKQFTATAIMILAEQGKLSIEDKLTKYITDYPNGDKITIHHLLSHTSGITNFTALPVYDSIRTKPHTLDQLIAYFKNKPLDFEPGAKFNYSNSGYLLLSYIIEKVSGQTIAGYMTNNIFEPLGMKNTGVFEGNNPVIKNLALGYTENEAGIENAPHIDMSIPSGAGALYSTVEDLFIWDQALYTDKLLKKETLQKMFTVNKDNYGYGWMHEKYRNHDWIFHSGGIEGFATNISRFPDDSLVIIILKNIDNQMFLPVTQITRNEMLGFPYELPVERKVATVDPKIYDKLCGDYELEPGFVLSITKENNRIFSQATDQPKLEIFPESEYFYFLKKINAQLEFTKDKKGAITSLTLLQGGRKMPAKKIK
ncbi:MAG: serine hydrolase domain-containing protein [Bacteroidota bacterium]|nr:serine hydrolase domain-containing protein [Bacteroidota bacterium]